MSFIEVSEGVPWPPPALPIVPTNALTNQQLFVGRGLLMGYSAEAQAAAARVFLYDGADATGLQLAAIDVPINSSDFPWFGDHGIYLQRGLFYQVVGGAGMSRFTAFVAPLWRPGA